MLTATFSRKGELISEHFHPEATDRPIDDLLDSFVEAAWEPISKSLEEVGIKHGGLFTEDRAEAAALQAN